MPYTSKQHRLFAAAATNPEVAKKVGISRATAQRLMKKPIKKPGKK